MCHSNVSGPSKLSRRDFLKLVGSAAIVMAFGSIMGFSSFLPSKNGKGSGYYQQVSAQSSSGTFVSGPNTNTLAVHAALLPNGKIFYTTGSGFSATYEHGPFYWHILDPSNDSIDTQTVDKDIFCMAACIRAENAKCGFSNMGLYKITRAAITLTHTPLAARPALP